MTVDFGIAKVQTLGLSDATPANNGAAQAGTSVNASRDDHVHRQIYGFGVFVGSDGLPQLETTSTLPYFYISSGNWLYWDSTEQYFFLGAK